MEWRRLYLVGYSIYDRPELIVHVAVESEDEVLGTARLALERRIEGEPPRYQGDDVPDAAKYTLLRIVFVGMVMVSS